MKIFAMIAAAAVLGAASAAYADTMENAYGNTITVTTAQATANYFVNADHTYTMTSGSTQVSGVWALKDNQVCLTPQGGQETCSPYDASHKVGDTWQMTGSDGSHATIAITAGRH
jgi:hypothetical protein